MTCNELFSLTCSFKLFSRIKFYKFNISPSAIPGFKSGGQVDNGRPVMHKFPASLANANSASDNPTPDWSYNCGPANSVCKMEDGSVKNMRVYMDNGK